MPKTFYRISAIEHMKRRALLDSLRKDGTPYLVSYDSKKDEYIVEVDETSEIEAARINKEVDEMLNNKNQRGDE